MASFDLKSNISNLNAFTPATINSDTTTAGVEISSQGFESVTFLIRASNYTDGTYTPLIQGTNTSGSGYVDVTDDFLIGTEADAALSAAGVSRIGVVADYEFYKLSFVSTSTSTGATLDAVAILGSPKTAPVS